MGGEDKEVHEYDEGIHRDQFLMLEDRLDSMIVRKNLVRRPALQDLIVVDHEVVDMLEPLPCFLSEFVGFRLKKISKMMQRELHSCWNSYTTPN